MGLGRCFPDCVFRAVQSQGDAFHPSSSSRRKSHIPFARGIRVPTWVASCSPPPKDAASRELVGDLAGEL